ncbi:MAG: hypothetical protein ABSC23_19840 [Bryobacteraceae bacterium]|jgi:tetratricopeptide (TPR) repeat protein
MKVSGGAYRFFALLLIGFGLALACAYDSSLREYLDAHFWLPFARRAGSFEKKNVRRMDAPYAGMADAAGNSPLAKLRAAYQEIPIPDFGPVYAPPDAAKLHGALAAARADQSLTPREREEVDLLDAKIDMRIGEPEGGPDQLLRGAEKKLQVFLRSARTPEFRSEARGWLAHIYYLLGEQTAAGKIYLDELNRNGSNLSRETLLNSLRMTYGYDGGQELLDHLDEYFDTPEHAAFAIQLTTNPHWYKDGEKRERADEEPETYARIKALLEKHGNLLNSNTGSHALAMLGMRTALRMGDPPAALEIAAKVPGDAAIRSEPDFEWMLASAHFLSHGFAAAEAPLLELFRSPRASASQKAAAAYGLCGVYWKTGNRVEQIRFALWLHGAWRDNHAPLSYPSDISDQSIYWAESGWDLNLLLDAEAPDDALEAFLRRYPDAPDARLVQYALAVRFARENRYDEAAQIYESIYASQRAPRMRQLAALYREANRTDLTAPQLQEARYKLAEFISANPDRIYFNDRLWSGMQRYALNASSDGRLTREERETLMTDERKLKDDQEERWRAYLILREVVKDPGKTELGRKAAQLAIRCLRGISDRFERQDEIRMADIELSNWLRH